MLTEVPPERLVGWVERFAASHGEVSWCVDGQAGPATFLGTAADGSWARLEPWRPASGTDLDPDTATRMGPGVDLGRWAVPPVLLVLLVRRGGYAAAVASPSGEIVASKVGTRHVQSRTAAGGWSQQRYARRRSNQADALLEAAAGHAARVLGEGEAAVGPVGGLVLGGDRALSASLLEAVAGGPRARLHGIPRRELPDLGDPRRAVLEEAVRRGRAVRVTVHNA